MEVSVTLLAILMLDNLYHAVYGLRLLLGNKFIHLFFRFGKLQLPIKKPTILFCYFLKIGFCYGQDKGIKHFACLGVFD